MNLPLHGSNPHYLYDALNIPMPERWSDFSVNLNPLGQPDSLSALLSKGAIDFRDYPDPIHTSLRRRISISEGIDPGGIIVGNGAAEVIHMIACLLRGKKVAVVHPAFSEYELTCRAFSCSIEHVIPSLIPEFEDFAGAIKASDAIFICNPNNPAGTVMDPVLLEEIIGYAEENDCLVIVDEAFHDFLPQGDSCKKLLGVHFNLIILRSMTKMFSMAGIRLGFALMAEELKSKLEKYQTHWSVNSFALCAGEICLEQQDFVMKTRGYVARERARMFCFLKKNDFSFSRSQTNFYLMKDNRTEQQIDLIIFLLKNGIVPRHTYNFRGLEGRWLRMAVKDEESNNLLMEVLEKWREN
ncbi:pyridoxal phosphate-dependent aminotransferase [Bacillus salacetis]|uniref:pyridoxal phosphate-dependent aminotransferase n=1 Tax=Bacillus salacetis TaxID=2315464 RepID=UPI003BA31689